MHDFFRIPNPEVTAFAVAAVAAVAAVGAVDAVAAVAAVAADAADAAAVAEAAVAAVAALVSACGEVAEVALGHVTKASRRSICTKGARSYPQWLASSASLAPRFWRST